MSAPGRVGVLLVVDGLELGGAQTVVRALVRLADRTRFRMHVFNVARKHHPALVEAIAADADGLVPFSRSDAIWDPSSLAGLVRTIRCNRIDVVHTHLAAADVAGGLAAKLTGRPVVSTLHSVVTERATYRGRRRLLSELATRHLADRLVAVSDAVRRSHVEELGVADERVVVLPNASIAPHLLPEGFDAARTRAELRADGRVLVASVSRISPDRDHESLIRAVARLDDRSRLKLVLAGGGTRKDELERLARALGVADVVEFLGLRLDAIEILAASDVVCQPTLYEGMPVTVLDAMALGRPVLATAVPGVTGLVEHGETGVLVPPRDPGAMAAALERLLTSPEERRRLGEAARARARERYDADLWIRANEAVYLDLVRHPGGRRYPGPSAGTRQIP